jgi:hypothetical protein
MKIPGNEPVLQSNQGLTDLLVAARTRCHQTMTSEHAEVSHEASDIIRNHSRYPSHCCNHNAVVAFTSEPKSGHWTNSTNRIASTKYGRGNGQGLLISLQLPLGSPVVRFGLWLVPRHAGITHPESRLSHSGGRTTKPPIDVRSPGHTVAEVESCSGLNFW